MRKSCDDADNLKNINIEYSVQQVEGTNIIFLLFIDLNGPLYSLICYTAFHSSVLTPWIYSLVHTFFQKTNWSQDWDKKIGAFVWSGFGIWNLVSDAFAVPLVENAPEKCVFIKHVPRLRLKMNPIARTEFCTWKWVCWLINCQGY